MRVRNITVYEAYQYDENTPHEELADCISFSAPRPSSRTPRPQVYVESKGDLVDLDHGDWIVTDTEFETHEVWGNTAFRKYFVEVVE
jgi:hypothetical protein